MNFQKILLLSVLLINFMSSCQKNIDHIIKAGVSPDDIIRFDRIDSGPLYADSFSQILVRVRVANQTNEQYDIKLTANGGRINGSTAAVTLRSNLEGYADFYFIPGQSAVP